MMHVTTFSIHEPETAQIWQLIESPDSGRDTLILQESPFLI